MRGLVVDDSSVMRKVLTGALSRVNISEVDEAPDGKVAVALVAGDKEYDVILMDWNMPNMKRTGSFLDARYVRIRCIGGLVRLPA